MAKRKDTVKLLRWMLLIIMVVTAGYYGWLNRSLFQQQSSFSPQMVKTVIGQIDHDIASVIRNAAQNGVNLPKVGSLKMLNDISSATVSAQVSTSPGEIWQTFKKQGSQAVLGDLAQGAEVTINDVSAAAWQEARYQYCQGVVEEYERSVE